MEEFDAKIEADKENKVINKPRVEKAPVVKECSAKHSSYELGVLYKEEPNSKYFDKEQQLHNTKCYGCKVMMVPTGATTKGVQFRATTKRPAFACLGRTSCGCRVVVCFDCFFGVGTNGETDETAAGKKRKRSTRGRN